MKLRTQQQMDALDSKLNMLLGLSQNNRPSTDNIDFQIAIRAAQARGLQPLICEAIFNELDTDFTP
jgi:hypothetical protein